MGFVVIAVVAFVDAAIVEEAVGAPISGTTWFGACDVAKPPRGTENKNGQ